MATASKRLRYEILRRDNFACRYCGRSAPEVKLTVDAVLPEALGGSHKDAANLIAACADCNSGKASTSPDAPLVADVAQDAFRWSQAMAVASAEMLARASEHVDAQEHFAKSWARFGSASSGTRRKPLPKDANWRHTVDQLLSAGLPLSELEDCIDIAMSRRNVAEDRVFRYMCGCAWTKVNELQARAAELLKATAGTDPGDDEEYSPAELKARREMACEFLGDLAEDELEIALDEMRSTLGDTDADIEVYAAFAEFHGAVRDRRQMADCLRYFLDHHPDGERFLDEAFAHLRATFGVFPPTEIARVASLMLIRSQSPEMAT